MKLDFAYIGHPVLRKKAAQIQSIDSEIFELIENMKQTLLARKGLGLAAPQVGASVALFLTCFPIKDPAGHMHPGPVKIFINPKISNPSHETWDYEEGCLSIPTVFANVSRPVSITVTYQDETGTYHTEQYSEWPARIIMHENDHINGTLFIDRLSHKNKKRIAKAVDHIKKQYTEHNSALKSPISKHKH